MFWAWALFGGIIGGAAVLAVRARETASRLAQVGDEHVQTLQRLGTMTEADLRELADAYAQRLEATARERIATSARATVDDVLVREYGLTPSVREDLRRVARLRP